jgi:FkbH-like protein
MGSSLKAFGSIALKEGNQTSSIMLHSSIISSTKAERKKIPYGLLQEILSLSRRGITFILPSYTFSFCSTGIFDVTTTKSETGTLADLVHTYLPGSIRSLDPIYSHVFIGPLSKDLSEIHGETTFGKGSIFEKVEDLNSYVGVLNVEWRYATIFHRYEELAHVPYRYYKTFEGSVKGYDGHSLCTKAEMYVRDLDINPENDMNLALPLLREQRSFKRLKDHGNHLEFVKINDLRGVAIRMLDKDAWSLIANKNAAKLRQYQIQTKESSPTYNIAIIGPGNVDPFGEKLLKYLTKNIPAKAFNVWTCPFGQMLESILDASSHFNENPFDIIISPANSSDFNLKEDISLFKTKVERYLAVIQSAAQSKGCRAILHRIDTPSTARHSGLEKQVRERIDFYNNLIESISAKNENIVVIDQCMLSNQYNEHVNDKRLFYIGRIGYSLQFAEILIKSWASYISDLLGFSIRALVLDLDNTLWGGIVGEDGVDQLQIGGDFPGNCFYDFQSFLVSLESQGILLSIASKNNLTDAEAAFKELKMPLQLNKFSAVKINWEEKYLSIKSIAHELNIGLSSILFVDDNPAEREKVKHFLPEVHVLDLPSNPDEYVDSLQKYLFLSCATSPLDQKIDRRKSIEISQKISELQSSASENTLNDYLVSLNVCLSIEALSTSNLQRAEQLCHKTNQFNTTTTRYSARTLMEIENSKDCSVLLIGHQSKDQSYEIMGLIVVRIEEKSRIAVVDSYLLSCRILGRGIEETCIAWLAKKLHINKQAKYLVGKVVPTQRNQPAQGLYAKLGFEPQGKGEWLYDLKSYESLPIPSHVNVVDKTH